ncbi:MAG: glycosyltransferase family 4 protein [Desulfovibrio sp.]|nr:glycosyltransferase family 4 protein [Desulfovibrio sp.]
MKVCLYISAIARGGAERQIRNLARELAGRGVTVTLLHEEQSHVQDAQYLDAIRKGGVEVISILSPEFLKAGMPLSGRHGEFFAHIPAMRPRKMTMLFLAGALFSLRPDIVHSYLDIPNCIAGCAAVLAGVPVHLASFRSIDPATGHYPWEDAAYPLYRYLIRHGCSHFEANSRLGAELYARWLNLPPESVAYCPNGLDPQAYLRVAPGAAAALRESLGIPPAAPVLLSLGRFSPEKAPEAMLDIFARVLTRHPEARYVIAGLGMTGDEEMGAMVRERGLERAVYLLGARGDVAALLRAADIFLLPSRFEGFPNAIMEAMAAGVPVVTSNVGGIPDLVRHRKDGFLHDARDAAGMAESVSLLLEDAETRARLAESARQRILNEFSLKKLGDRVLARYEELLAHPEGTGARAPTT